MAEVSEQTYTIGTKQQLVDLNGDAVNFKIIFHISSHDGKPFESVIIDQSTLDNSEHIEYRHISDGVLSGEIVADKNVYQNYFIALRSPETMNVNVRLEFEKLPDYIEHQAVSDSPKPKSTSPFGLSNTSLILLVCSIVLILVLLYRARQPSESVSSGSLLDKLKNANIT